MRNFLRKRISLVLAMLFILGIAYGVSVFAENASQSAPVTLDSNYVYLNPAGMTLNGTDWSSSGADIYFGIVGSSQGLIKADYDDSTGCWIWKTSELGFNNGDSIYFTYTNVWDGSIKAHPYYRTEEYTVSDDIGGKVFIQNGASSTPIDNQTVYALKELTANAGSKLSFVDMTGSLSGVKAQFSYDGNYENEGSYTTVDLDDVTATVPENDGIKIYQYMRFVTSENVPLTNSISIEEALSDGGILYYGIKQSTDNIGYEWSEDKTKTSEPQITKLYFDKTSFPVSETVTIKIGNGEAETVTTDSDDTTILSYDLTGVTLKADTIIEITKGDITYRFYPNSNQNLVTIEADTASINGIYRNSDGTYTVYFDATLSKLSYAGDTTDNSLPKTNEDIYFYAWSSTGKQSGKLDSAGSDLYKADLNNTYTNILFYSATYDVISSGKGVDNNSSKTYDLTIPWSSKTNPCFYADSSDDSIYNGNRRSGYWDEVGKVRNADGKTKDGVDSNAEVVDVTKGTFTRDSDKLYVSTTLYDYYTDYELNGNNRDNYDTSANVNSHRIYQPFRQLDQALSDYYEANKVTSPLYTGNFQNYNDANTKYTNIASTLNLYGYNDYAKFFYENNSMWDINGNVLSSGNNATQGLVSNSLVDGKIALNTGSGTTALPYFDEDFLSGNNSKNTVLGKVYNNVTFPFVKKSLTSQSVSSTGTVEYWYFDSADNAADNKNLELRQDESGSYFLQSTETVVKGQTANTGNPPTPNGNYFPFNDVNQSGNSRRLNYGFGQRFDLTFKLTSDGTVKDTAGNSVPIEFNFSGDDDVWVFIDGKLVLDIGGGHSVVSGTIDFANKKAIVSSVKSENGGSYNGDDGKGVVYNFSDVSAITDNYFTKEHTLTMFYMERGLWESNMKITFNFPDENEFEVEKDVNTDDVDHELFPDSLFTGASVFPFTIQNQATHFDTKEASSDSASIPLTYNDTFSTNTLSKNTAHNTFEYYQSKDGQENVVHWKALNNDTDGKYKDKRWGVIKPKEGDSFNASAANRYLQFKMYYDYNDTPGLASTYIELEDSSGITIGGYLSGKTYGNSSLKNKTWNTITVDLKKLQGTNTTFNYASIKNIKFDYNYERNIYLDDFVFVPSSVVTASAGFVTKQYDIPDYGSVKSGTLMYPENAVYTISSANGSASTSTTHRMGADGTFALANGETATFTDQFRRGSYISLSEDVDQEIFETTWTLYENGEQVNSMADGTTVDISHSDGNVRGVNGTYIKDGRMEVYQTGTEDGKTIENSGYTATGWAKKNGDRNTEDENTIVFRSFSYPDGTTTATRLKVKYINKVKTGSIIIKKGTADNSDPLTGEYTFRVEFKNVANMSLESETISKDYKVKAGGQITITGIPAGTDYRIYEVSSTDDSTLENVDISSSKDIEERYKPTISFDDEKKLTVVAGKVKADAADETTFIFNNTKKPVVTINVTKKWDNVEGITLPESIKIKLQRRASDDAEWEDVKYPFTGQENDNAYVEIGNSYGPVDSWKYSFNNLDRYVDYKATPKVAYQYRVVELGDDGKVVEADGYFNELFKVTYSDIVSVPEGDGSDSSGTAISKDYTITNTYSPKTNIKITKVDSKDHSIKLSGVKFKLEKLIPDTGGDNYTVDTTFEARIATTGDTSDLLGIAEFTDLPDGIYRLTEIEAKDGYSLLKDPITIKICRTGTTTVDNEEYTFGSDDETKNTISLEISNRMKFLLPQTGGYGAMLFILCGMALATLACLIFFLIALRKEVKYSKSKKLQGTK